MVDQLGQSAFIGDHRVVSTEFDDRETTASRGLCVAVALALCPHPTAVLDLGCGTGEILALLRARLPEAHLVGVDPVPDALDGARRLLGDDPALTLLETTAESLEPTLDHARGGAPDGEGPDDLPAFDLALCHLDLALWGDPVAGLAAAARRLAPDGVLYVVDLARVEVERRTRLLQRARTDAERAYLAGQIDASLDLDAGRRVAEQVVAATPELDLTARCAARWARRPCLRLARGGRVVGRLRRAGRGRGLRPPGRRGRRRRRPLLGAPPWMRTCPPSPWPAGCGTA